jgi:uncharacterized protein YcaQ
VDDARVAGFRLSRHRLRPRAPRGSLVETARAIGGLHAQVMSSADLSLWARVRGHASGDLARALWEERSLVKTWLMRGTLHLVPADDLPLYVSALDPRGDYNAAWLRYYKITAADVERLLESVAAALDGECLTRVELAAKIGGAWAKRLESGWGEFLKPASRRGVLCFGPSRGQNVTFVRPDQWVSGWRDVPQAEAMAELVRRYLRVHAPATKDDFDRWVGSLRRARFAPAWNAVADELVELEPKHFALAEDAAALARARPARSVQLLGGFDPYVLSPRSGRPFLLGDPAHTDRVYRTAGWISPTVIDAGRIVGVWSHERRGKSIAVEVEPFERLGGPTREGVEREARSLARFLGGRLQLVC